MTVVCGIDPGAKGGLAFIDSEAGVRVDVLPHVTRLVEELRLTAPDIVYLEKAQTFPGQGICGAFNYGDHFGQLQGILITMKIPYQLVTPLMWTRVMHVGCTGKDAKAKSLQAARRLFPSVDLLATARSRVPHDGMVDALLIAAFGAKRYG
jgi:hypothetical protein